jgi:hypothetical protein
MQTKFTVIARRWFQKSYGNTYSSATIFDDQGQCIAYLPMEYGYGDYALGMAGDWLVAQGLVAAPKSGGTQSTRWAREEAGIDYHVSDVLRQKDL